MCAYTASDIARYVVNYSNSRHYSISNLKLQKLLYYIQAGFLVEKGHECFSDEISSWQHGPVVRSVYNEYRRYTNMPIPEQRVYNVIDVRDGKLVIVPREFSEEDFREEDKELMNRIIDGMGGCDAWSLVRRTHEEEPWKAVHQYNEEITQESIRQYFSAPEHKGRIYGEVD